MLCIIFTQITPNFALLSNFITHPLRKANKYEIFLIILAFLLKNLVLNFSLKVKLFNPELSPVCLPSVKFWYH